MQYRDMNSIAAHNVIIVDSIVALAKKLFFTTVMKGNNWKERSSREETKQKKEFSYSISDHEVTNNLSYHERDDFTRHS